MLDFILVIVACVACFVSGFLWHKMLCRKVEKIEPCESLEDILKREG